MKHINFDKKSGFSLMELTMALLIVAILLVITLPIVNRQLKKSEEYSYFLAYKTVEKMAGQIVALGDPEEETTSMAPENHLFRDYLFAKFNDSKRKFDIAFRSGKEKLAALEFSVFTRLFPKALAEDYISVYSWGSDDMDEIWLAYYVCHSDYGQPSHDYIYKGEETVIVNDVDSEGKPILDAQGKPKQHEETVNVPWSKYDFDCCYGYTKQVGNAGVQCKIQDDAGKFIQVAKVNGACPQYTSVEEGGKCYKTSFIRNLGINSVIKQKLFNGLPYFDDNKTSNVAVQFVNAFNSHDKPVWLNDMLGYAITESRSLNKLVDMKTLCETNYKVALKDSRYVTNYSTFYDAPDEEDSDTVDPFPHLYVRVDGEYREGNCTVSVPESVESVDESIGDAASATRPTYASNWCDLYKEGGSFVYRNMTNVAAPNGIDCQPKSGYVLSANNDKVACPKCTKAGQTAYATGSSSNPCLCTEYDFDEIAKASCGPNAVYTGTSPCTCITGWERPTGSSECTKRTACPKGTTQQADGTCVTNPPIIDAKRFCELVDENWNVSSHKCDNTLFKDGVYEGVYNAALGSNTKHTYLSVKSKPNAFKNLTPNIVLSNGLKMWILGNKAASIPGLSYFPNDSSKSVAKDQNMCVRIPLTTYSKNACKTAASGSKNWYYCSHDKNCFKLTASSGYTGTRTTELFDARGCCANSDVVDFHEKSVEIGDPTKYLREPTVYAISGFTVFVDINGEKGEGTLWEDVFPFFISSNGSVYPGYPLDSEKELTKSDGTTETGNALYQGGNSDSYLPVDVYYYESNDDGSARVKKVAFSNVSYARGVCSARKVSRYTPYCMNLGKKYKGKGIKPKSGGGYDSVDLPENYIALDKDTNSYNPCDYYSCYVSVKNKLRFF